MNEFALYINDQFKEIRVYQEKPVDIAHKSVKWYPVVREYGNPETALENNVYYIRTVDPTTLPSPVPESVSDRQFFHALALNGSITKEEALAAVKVGDIPATLTALINQMPEEEKFNAEILLSGATVFERNHPLTNQLGSALGYTSEEIDDLFRAAGAL